MSESDSVQALAVTFDIFQRHICQQSPHASPELLSAIKHLRQVVELPEDTTARIVQQHLEAACLRKIMENGILASLCSVGHLNWSASKLAEACQGEMGRIDAIMKILTTAGIVNLVRDHTYAANNVTSLLNSSEQRLAIRKPRSKHWEAIAKGRMSDRTSAKENRAENKPWYRIFPIETELRKTDGGLKSDRALIVDVGGALDRSLFDFRKVFPQLKGTYILEVPLADLRRALHLFRKHFGSRLDGPLQLLAYDALTDTQPVQGARIYLLNGILHNQHNNENILVILQNTVKEMDKNYSHILIVEKVVLVLGAGDDVDIRTSEGIARTERQWTQLLDRAGLELVQIWEEEGCITNVIEAMVKHEEWI